MSAPLRALVADADAARRALLQRRLAAAGPVEAAAAADAQAAFASLRERLFDMAFLDHALLGEEGLKALEQVRQLHPKTAVVLLGEKGNERLAVEAMRRGAIDYLPYQDLEAADLAQLLRRAEEMRSLQGENLELRQVSRMKDEFIASVSHELRTPLAIILGYARAMEEGMLGPLTPQQAHAARAIRGRGEALLEVLNQLLAFKDTSGVQRVLLRPLDLARFAAEHLDARWGAPGRGMRLERDLPPGPVWVLGDPEQLREVLQALLTNAVKFSAEGGAITVRIEARGPEAWLCVADRGRGIPTEVLPGLFELFHRAEPDLTRETPGLGLGLALARQLVELHAGRIWLESEGSGKGATAYVALPMADPAAPEVLVERKRRLERKRVLLLDDNPDFTELIRLFLLGFSDSLELTSTHSGQEALELMTRSRFDLAVLDLVLPGLSGFEVLERLRRLPGGGGPRVLILTGHRDGARQAMLQGADDFLLKPFDKKTFLQKVLRLLGQDLRSRPR